MNTATISNGPRWGLSAFALKVIACVTMLCDHVGAYLFPEVRILRIIGRLAFPIFAFFIAEGCRYTRHKLKRFLLVFGLAVICEVAYLVATDTLTGTALVTFSCSIPIIYALQAFKKSLVQKGIGRILLSLLALLAAGAAAVAVDYFVPIDYGLSGVMIPVLVSVFDYREGEAPAFLRRLDCHWIRLGFFAVGLVILWLIRGPAIQLYALFSLIPMALYNGRPGIKAFKYWFYIFYPAHLLLIALIQLLMERSA